MARIGAVRGGASKSAPQRKPAQKVGPYRSGYVFAKPVPKRKAPAPRSNPFTQRVGDYSALGIQSANSRRAMVRRQDAESVALLRPGARKALLRYYDVAPVRDKQNLVRWAVNSPGLAGQRALLKHLWRGTGYTPDRALRNATLDLPESFNPQPGINTEGVSKALGNAVDWARKQGESIGDASWKALVSPSTVRGTSTPATAGYNLPKTPKFVKNLGADAAAFYPNAALAAYQIGRDTLNKGPVAAAKKDIYEPIKQVVENPVESFNKNPITTAFILKGAAHVPGRAGGAVLRKAPVGRLQEIGSTGRAFLETEPTVGPLVRRQYSKDVLVKQAQKAKDRFLTEPVAQAEVARNVRTGRAAESDKIARLRTPNEDASFLNPVEGVRNKSLRVAARRQNSDLVGARVRRADQRSNYNDASKREERGTQQVDLRRVFGTPVTQGVRVTLGDKARIVMPDGYSGRVAAGDTTLPAEARVVKDVAYLPDGSRVSGVVWFKPPRKMKGGAEKAANYVSRSLSHVTKAEERGIVGMVADRGVITPKGNHVQELSVELRRIQDARVSRKLSGEELQSNLRAEDAVQAALKKAKGKGLDADYVFRSARRYRELRNVEEARAVDAEILDPEVARRRRMTPAAEQHGLVEFDTGGMLSGRALAARAARDRKKLLVKGTKGRKGQRNSGHFGLESLKKQEARAAERLAKTFDAKATNTRVSLEGRRVAAEGKGRGVVKDARNVDYVDLTRVKELQGRLSKAREEHQYALGKTIHVEGPRTQRLLRDIQLQAEKMVKSGNRVEREYATTVLEAIKNSGSDPLTFGRLLDEAAGQLAGGAKRGNKERLPSGRVVQVNARVGYLRDKLADVGRSNVTEDLLNKQARVLGLTSELKQAKRVAAAEGRAARKAGIEAAQARGAQVTADALAEAEYRANRDLTRAKIAENSALARYNAENGGILRDAEIATKAAVKKAGNLKRFKDEKTVPRFVEAGKKNTPALEIATSDLDKLLRDAGVDTEALGYVPHRPGDPRKGDYYKRDSTNRTETLMGDLYTGSSLRRANYDASYAAMESRLVSQALTRSVMNSMADMIREIGVPGRNGKGELQLFTTDAAVKKIADVQAEGGPRLIAVRAFRASDKAASEKLSETLENNKDGISVGNVYEQLLEIKVDRGKVLGNSEHVTGIDLAKESGQTANIYLVDGDAMGRILKHAELQMPGGWIGASFRRTVLPFSPRWIGGNLAEAILRSGIEGVTPVHARVYADFLTKLALRDEQWANELRMNTEGGQMLGSQMNMIVKTDRSLAREQGQALGGGIAGEGAKLVNGLVVKSSDAMFKANKRVEDAFQRGAVGKHTMTALKEFGVSWSDVIGKQGQAMELLLDTFDKDPRKAYAHLDSAARYTNEVIGKYNQFSPEMRRSIQAYAPFIPWFINSVRFFSYTLPVKHPLLTTMLAASTKAIDQSLKDQVKNAPSEALRHGIPLGNNDILDVARITPLGVATEPVKTLAKEFVPVIMGPAMIGLGLSPIDPTRPLRDENGDKITSNWMRAFLAMNAFAESVTPFLGLGRRLQTPGQTQADNSWFFDTKVRKNSARKNPLMQFVSPVPVVHYGGASSGSKSIFDQPSGSKKSIFDTPSSSKKSIFD